MKTKIIATEEFDTNRQEWFYLIEVKQGRKIVDVYKTTSATTALDLLQEEYTSARDKNENAEIVLGPRLRP